MEGKKKTEILLETFWVNVQQQETWELQLITCLSKKLCKLTSNHVSLKAYNGTIAGASQPQESIKIWKVGQKMIYDPCK